MNPTSKSMKKGASRHVYKSGAAGCGGKASPVAPKNSGQVIQCIYCDRTFKQDGRYKEHLKNKHANDDPEQVQLTNSHAKLDTSELAGDGGLINTQSPSQSSYAIKTPKTLLHEWCQKSRKPAPRFKHVEVEGGFHCRVVLPDPKKSEADVILWYSEKATQTSQEAQHCAAVLALHHVMGDRRAGSKLHVILMSATVEAELFAYYFKERLEFDTAIVNIPGFTFPVQELYLEDVLELTGYKVGRNSPYTNKSQHTEMVHEEKAVKNKEADSWENQYEDEDRSNLPSASCYSQITVRTLSALDQSIVNYDLLEALICLITQQGSHELYKFGHVSDPEFGKENAHRQIRVHLEITGAVLVFLPGIAEIYKLQSRLQSSSRLAGISIWVLTLHGSMSGEEQRRVFQKPPKGFRKVVLTTNVAETSITIDDVIRSSIRGQ